MKQLLANGMVMPPELGDCTIPAEVIQAAGEGLMMSLQACGLEPDFADARAPS